MSFGLYRTVQTLRGQGLTPAAYKAPPQGTPRAVFRFDDRSLESIEQAKARGLKFMEIPLIDPDTGEERTLVIPSKYIA